MEKGTGEGLSMTNLFTPIRKAIAFVFFAAIFPFVFAVAYFADDMPFSETKDLWDRWMPQ